MDLCRFYRRVNPLIEEVVAVKIINKNEFGYKVNLLEFQNIEGFLSLSELVVGKTRKKKIVKIGEVIPLIVTKIDGRSIDLSKKKLTDTNIESYHKKFKFAQHLQKVGMEINWMYQSYQKRKGLPVIYTIEEIIESTIWQLFNDSSETNYEELFNSVLKNPVILFQKNVFPSEFQDYAIKNIKERIVKRDMILQIHIVLSTTVEDGVSLIKEILSYAKCNTDGYCIKIYMESPPIYKINLIGPDNVEGEVILNEIISNLAKISEEKKAMFELHDKIQLIKEPELDLKFITEYELNQI